MKQTKNYTCAPANIRYILHEYKKLGVKMELPTEEELEIYLNCTPSTGTNIQDIVDFLNDNGFTTEYKTQQTIEDLQTFTQDEVGKFIILLVMVDVPHYVTYFNSNEQHISMWDSMSGEFTSEIISKFVKSRNVPDLTWCVDLNKIKQAAKKRSYEFLNEYDFTHFESERGAIYISRDIPSDEVNS